MVSENDSDVRLEPPSVASRWRVLTRQHLRSFVDLDAHVQRSSRQLAAVMTDVLLTCGVEGSREIVSGALDEFQLDGLVELALQFQECSGQYVSKYFRPWTPRAGDEFDDTIMDHDRTELDGLSHRSTRNTVICITQLGLVADIPRSGPAGRRVPAILVVKPKVVLQAAKTHRST